MELISIKNHLNLKKFKVKIRKESKNYEMAGGPRS